jgi:hypothetical protein
MFVGSGKKVEHVTFLVHGLAAFVALCHLQHEEFVAE